MNKLMKLLEKQIEDEKVLMKLFVQSADYSNAARQQGIITGLRMAVECAVDRIADGIGFAPPRCSNCGVYLSGSTGECEKCGKHERPSGKYGN